MVNECLAISHDIMLNNNGILVANHVKNYSGPQD